MLRNIKLDKFECHDLNRYKLSLLILMLVNQPKKLLQDHFSKQHLGEEDPLKVKLKFTLKMFLKLQLQLEAFSSRSTKGCSLAPRFQFFVV